MITRSQTNARMSQMVKHNGIAYLAGQVGTEGDTIANQVRQCLEKVDALLAEAGSSKEKMLSAVVWLADMKDFAEMNAVWEAWVPAGHAPARATGEVKLATPGYMVEFIITAAC